MPDDPRIRERREALGMTRVQLATAANVSLTYVSNLEAGLLPKYQTPRYLRVVDHLAAEEARRDERAGNH